MRKLRSILSARAVIAFVLSAVILAFGGYQLYLTLKYRLYDGYKAALAPVFEPEAGTPFTPLTGVSAAAPGFQPAAQSPELILFIDAKTGGIAVYDKRTEGFAYSNPPDAASDPAANQVNREALQSQLLITYFDSNGKIAEYSSNKMAAMAGQIELASITGGVRVTYTLGDTKPKAGLLPLYIARERLDETLSRIEDERTRGLLARRWEAYDGHPGVMRLITQIVNNPSQQKSMITQFERIGYTDEDRRRDEAESGVPLDQSAGFVIPVEYRLSGDSMVVTIPTRSIAEVGGAHLESVRLLPFMGAAGTGESGYMVVPNGSGSLIRFNNARVNAEDYRQYVYRQDPLLIENAAIDVAEAARLPLFGIQREGGQGMLARIERGAPLAQITASVSGKLNSYNYVNASFVLRGASAVAVSGASNETLIPVVEKPLAELDITVRYTFLTDEYAGYSGMARYERGRLISEGSLSPMPDGGDIPFFMDVIGSTQGRKFFLDIAYSGQVTMTTYAQAALISRELAALGAQRQIVNYQGWFNRGYYHDEASRIYPLRELGGISELSALRGELEQSSGKLVSDVIFQNIPYTSKRYNYIYENSRYYGYGYAADFGLLNPLDYTLSSALGGYPDLVYNQLSPRYLGRHIESFMGAFARYIPDAFTGISLRDLGDTLASDRRRTLVISRAEAEDIVADSLAKLADQHPLTVRGGNYYALPYASELTDIPTTHNNYYIVDEEIPWYEMIVSGCISYSGPAINLTGTSDTRDTMLRLIELGASPHYTFTYGSASDMKYTALKPACSTLYSDWIAEAAEIYREVNDVLRQVSGRGIVSHESPAEGVKRVAYEGGTVIYINYNEDAAEVGNILIPAKGCTIDGGAI